MTSSNKERVYLQLYDYETKEFSGLTTYHGLVRIYNSSTWPSRIFWSVVVLSCLSLFMIHSGYLLLGYHSKPTLFQVNTIVPKNGILFPDVTICNMNPISIEKVKKYKMNSSVLSYVSKFLLDVNRLEEGVTEQENKEYESYTRQYYSETGKQFDVITFFKNVSKQCEETFVSCSFGGREVKNCCEHVVTEMSEIGVCFRLSDHITEHRQWYSGEGFGWDFVLNGNNEIEEDYQVDADYGFYVMIHEKNKYPQIASHASSVSPNAELHASVSMKNISLLDKANWGTCTMNWPNNGTSIPYTATNCEARCKMDKIISLCRCSPLAYSTRYSLLNGPKTCSPLDLAVCFDNLKENWQEECDCGSECNLLEFSITNSYTSISSHQRENLPRHTSGHVKENISFVSLFFRHVAYERIEQQKQLQTADLLSNIAGSMGLFLGMSTVTLLEIFIYLFKSVWGTVNSARQKQFIEAVAEEERERQQSIVIIQSNEKRDNMNATEGIPAKEERRHSGNSIHIHLDRRNSRMVRGGDLLSAPRGSVSIPSQLLSPLSRHNRQSISSGQLARKTSTNPSDFFTSTRNYEFANLKSPLRRNSSITPSTIF